MSLIMRGPHIQAAGYRQGRARKRWPSNGITFLALHTAEGARDEIELGNFFHTHATGSSNAGIGQDGGYATYVAYGDTPWTNPPISDDTETLEICGFAAWSRADWLTHSEMLHSIASWIAWRSKVNGIPIRRVEGSSLARGVKGIVDHDGINDVFHESSHWDVGESFPWDIVLTEAKKIQGSSTNGIDEVVKPGHSYTVKQGDTYFKIAKRAYKDGSHWTTVAKVNGNVELKPGMRIEIPTESEFGRVRPVALGKWPGYDKVKPGFTSNQIRLLTRKLRHAVGREKAQELNPSGATGTYGTEVKALVKYALRDHPDTWDTGATSHDGIVGPKSWRVIASL